MVPGVAHYVLAVARHGGLRSGVWSVLQKKTVLWERVVRVLVHVWVVIESKEFFVGMGGEVFLPAHVVVVRLLLLLGMVRVGVV